MKTCFIKFLDATIGWLACWSLGGLRHRLHLNADVPPSLAGRHIKHALVVRPGGIGDMVLLLPALQALRRAFPGVVIDVLCERRNRDVLSLANWPDPILQYDAPFQMLGHLRRTRYDVVIDSEQFHYFSALMCILARTTARIGFKISPGRNLLYTHLINYDLEGHETDQFMALLRPLGITPPDSLPQPVLSAPAELPAPVANIRTRPEACLISLHPGGTTSCKQWAPERFAELLQQLGNDSRLVFAILGNQQDQRLAESIAARSGLGPRILSVAGRLSLAETAAVLAQSSVCIGGDSGIAHIAAALNTPTITLFGPSDSRKWGNRSGPHTLLQHPPDCAPCCIFGYHKLCHSIACMAAIPVSEVETACRRILP